MNIQTIYHKKNKIFEEEFFKDKECTEAFDFKNAKDLYIEPKDGDITPFLELSSNVNNCNICLPFLPKTKYYTLSAISYTLNENKNTLYTISETSKFTDGTFYNSILENIKTITPNLSKYIPKDNAVLFLDEECYDKYRNHFQQRPCELLSEYILPNIRYTIFLPHGTQSELQKLKEKYRVEEVNLFVLHCFIEKWLVERYLDEFILSAEHILAMFEYNANHKTKYTFNKIITTNSTGILKPEDSNERLQVIDCKVIFEESLN